MNFAVLTYQYVDGAPVGIPAAWPAEIVELGDDATLPGDNWTLMTADELATYRATHQASYSAWATPFYATPMATIVGRKIADAKQFGNDLIDSIAIQNVLTGITQVGKTKIFVDYCWSLIIYLKTGSLYAAVIEFDAMIADTSDAKTALSPFVTNANLEVTKNKIQSFLGVALT